MEVGMGDTKFVVRLYDGFDNLWVDVSEPVCRGEAERILAEKTDNGSQNTSFDDIDYYRIFPADTVMYFSTPQRPSEGEMSAVDEQKQAALEAVLLHAKRDSQRAAYLEMAKWCEKYVLELKAEAQKEIDEIKSYSLGASIASFEFVSERARQKAEET